MHLRMAAVFAVGKLIHGAVVGRVEGFADVVLFLISLVPWPEAKKDEGATDQAVESVEHIKS